jgi:probable HAF family extracellular repeat protein
MFTEIRPMEGRSATGSKLTCVAGSLNRHLSAQGYAITDITVVDDLATAEVALSDRGMVVGSSESVPAFMVPPPHSGHDPASLTTLAVFGSPIVEPTGVNNVGEITGIYQGPDGGPRAFLYWRGNSLDLGTLGGSGAVANAINNHGMVVGASETAAGAIHAFSFDGKLHDLGTARPSDLYSEAFAVDDHGVAVGRSGPSPDDAVATMFKDGRAIGMGTLGGDVSVATGINDAGLVCGFAELTSRAVHAFIYNDKRPDLGLKDLGTLGGATSIAGAINDRGMIVGQADTATTAETGLPDAFVDFGPGMIDLNELIPRSMRDHWHLVQALAVNGRGQIAGVGLHDGSVDVFLLTPVGDHFA